jgi:hypothetical protein
VSLKTRRNFRGWSPQQQEVQHLGGCQQGRATPPPETCPKETSGTWAAPQRHTFGQQTLDKSTSNECSSRSGLREGNAVKRHNATPNTGSKIKKGSGNELGSLCQGIRDIQGTNTCFFVELSRILKDRKITYGKLVCDHKPDKAEKERVRLTVGGDRLDYTGEVATSTETSKLSKS